MQFFKGVVISKLLALWVGFFYKFGVKYFPKGFFIAIPLSNMVRILQDAGFQIQGIRYVSLRWKDWLALPLALFIYPIQFFHMRSASTSLPTTLIHEMYPFCSLLSRHYILVCEKETS